MGSRVDFLREKCNGLICVVLVLIFSALCAAAGLFYVLNPVDPRNDEFALRELCKNISVGLIALAVIGVVVAVWSTVTMVVRYREADGGVDSS